MKDKLRLEVQSLLLGSGFAIFAGWVVGYPFLFLSMVLLWVVVRQFFSISRLGRWIEQGMKGRPPQVLGLLSHPTQNLYRFRQRNKEAMKSMRGTVHRISQLTHSISEGIVILGKDHTLEWWNVAAGRFIGLKPSDRRIVLTNLIRTPEFFSFLESCEDNDKFELLSPRDNSLWLMYTATRMGENEIVLVISDISQLKDVERMRKEFVGNVSHELRTPLTVLRGYLEPLTDGLLTDDPQVIKVCSQMSNQVLRMQAMADDLIALSRLESQPRVPQVEEFLLKPLLIGLVEEAKMISENRHEITLDCDQDLILHSNVSDLRSALGNLIVNAVKHNPEGSTISVSASLEEKDVLVKVEDDGVGISPELIPRLTERFYRIDKSRSSSQGGTGLGLAIVKHIVNRYGGNLEIESQKGSGSCFICRFPQGD